MNEQQAREDMVKLGASLFQRGYATGSAGNLSLKLADGTLLATPTGSCLGELNAERLSKVSLAGNGFRVINPQKRSAFIVQSILIILSVKLSFTCIAFI